MTPPPTRKRTSKARPNILWIITDQQSAGAMSCAGNDDLNTPNMDWIAQRGTRFENAYCPFPLCGPARASLFTGHMPHDYGVWNNGHAIPEEHLPEQLGMLMSEAGYDCGYGGKWHVPTASIGEGFGFENICPFNDTKLPAAAGSFIKRKRDKPFFLVASFDNPHNICEWARQQPLPWGDVPLREPSVCPNLPTNHAPGSFEPDIIELERRANYQVHPTINFTQDKWRQYRDAYFRLCEKVDAQIGKILKTLRDAKLLDNTVIIFTSDHGDGHGAHRWNQKSALFEEVVRIPLIIAAPAPGSKTNQVSEHLVNNGLDIFPTICDYAGVKPPKGLAGRSLRPIVATGKVKTWRDEVFCETGFTPPNYAQAAGRMCRTQKYKYVIYSMGLNREQLFDLENDPGEMVNLAVEKRYEKVLNEHRRRFRLHVEKTKDYFPKYVDERGNKNGQPSW